MLYRFLKVYVGIILKFFVKDIKINGMENIPADKAVMFASFHPNSFLDAILLDCIVDRPVWSLARGDAFKRDWVRDLLHKLYMMPIYRISEGKENLDKNDETFEKCSEVFRNKGQVLIFSEGLCANQTGLLPLKKGTARLALQTWSEGIDVTVIPTALNYNQFTHTGKKIVLNFEAPIRKEDFADHQVTGTNVLLFNRQLKDSLEQAVTRDFSFSTWRPVLYYLAFLVNFPVYVLLGSVVRPKTKGTVFFDSVYLATLIFALPVYWLIVFAVLMFLF
ncbi:1-acyl-sn-glycerol-3-phosphate acyltransferase [Leadbetterella sp. DM7]|uniref:1-acyl-sn-glycerol-3-phosphate acyltransferase n=1 Tax=Leadbetterella sp. DM7 TaxID=3235085 RepID=UPI00349EDC70